MDEVQFTPEQERAITECGGAVLVSAAAGSGKTRVLVERLMRRVLDTEKPCNIDEFLVITFTKKAASELRGRIAKALAAQLAVQPNNRHLARQISRLNLAQITTIDGFCSELVRENAFALNIPPDFRQIESEEAEQLRARIAASVMDAHYGKIASDEAFRHLVGTLGAGRSDSEIDSAIQQVYNSAQCHLFPEEWITRSIRALDMTQYSDAGQTPWGQRLIEDFRRFCAGKIGLLQGARQRAAADPIVWERYVPVLEREISQLETLCKLESWDALHAAAPQFETMPRFKQDEKSDLQEQVKTMRDGCKNALKKKLAEFSADSDTVMAELGQTSSALIALFELVREFSHAYAREKRRLRVQDFSDLEHGAVRLLLHENRKPKPLARELSTRYTEIMLDEYQDTNEVQDRLFAAISREGKNLFMVGDVKQAIYRFRLADPGIFLRKYDTFVPAEQAEPGQPRKILLSDNFRSDPGVLAAVNAVFSACMSRDVGELDYGEDERLRQGAPRAKLPGQTTELHCIDTKPLGSEATAPDKDETEADFVARRIRALLDEGTLICDRDKLRPVRPEDVVILLRSVANTAPIYARALRSHGIACQSERGQSLLDAPEIETLRSVLQIIDNPRQDIPLAAVLLSPLGGMPADTLASVRAGHRDDDLYTALTASDQAEAKGFLTTLEALRKLSASAELSELLSAVTDTLHAEEIYGLMPDGTQRLANLQQFFALAAEFAEGGRKSLSQFLAKLDTLHAEQQGETAEAGAVRIMSIHKSKGLEFPVVVLAGLSRKFNEQEFQKQVLLHPQLGAGCNVYDAQTRLRYHSMAKRAIISKLRAENRAEELRVLYVAMTRAKDRLIMTYCGGAVDGRLKTLAQRLTYPPEPLLAAEAVCPGDWVLEAALLRTEAHALFAAAQKPVDTQVSDYPWRITYQAVTDVTKSAAPETRQTQQTTQSVDEQAMLKALAFRYPHAAAVHIPAKITATQLKGRRLDEEVSDGSAVSQPLVNSSEAANLSALPERTESSNSPGASTLGATGRSLRRANFAGAKPLTPAQRGTATHLAMQYIDFARTSSVETVAQELQRLVAEAYLTKQQAEAVSAERLYSIFAGEIGRRIRSADKVVREFKFSILTDASIYDPAGQGEQMMLQGVTDCCLIKDGKLTVIDFKTDRIRPGEELQAGERYRGQLEAYSMALSRIFDMPVEAKILYFFATDNHICV